MAKKKPAKAETSLQAMAKQLANATAANKAVQVDLQNSEKMLDATYRAAQASTMMMPKESKAIVKQMKTAEERMANGHKIKVDFGGGVAAQVSTELMNLGVRALADWMPESWVGQNSDYLQGGPHIMLGLGVYILEMATRKKNTMPTTTREVISEAAKVFGNLGFSNVVRALRVRYADGKQSQVDMAALRAEKASLEQKLKAALAAAAAKK